MASLIVFLVLLLALIGWTLWAGIDALLQPERAWRQARISRGVTLVVLVIGCALGAAYYYLFVRPRLLRAQSS